MGTSMAHAVDESATLQGMKMKKGHDESRNDIIGVAESNRDLTGDSTLDRVREAVLGLEILWKERDKRVRVLRTLSNPWPKISQSRMFKESIQSRLQLPEARGAPVPHATFRKALACARGVKEIRGVLRSQLLRCETPYDINRVVATALVHGRHTQLHLSSLHEPIMRALYRCRNHVDDQEVLNTISGIRSRFKVYNIPFDPQFVMLGLKFAARTRNIRSMKKYLKALRQSNLSMSSNVFRCIIAKFSIGHRGLGEIRNGRWKRNELIQVCTGFHDCTHLPPSRQYHLGAWLDRHDWQYLHGWIAVLARCRASDVLWAEWEMWKRNPSRLKPKKLTGSHTQMTTKTRGDTWFVEQMTCSGDLAKAWAILEESQLEFMMLKERIKMCLVQEPEHAKTWTDGMRGALLRKYDTELAKIEKALGVVWVRSHGDDDGEGGKHIPCEDQEEALERLSADGWKMEEDFGYPIDDETVVLPQGERSLRDATESEFA